MKVSGRNVVSVGIHLGQQAFQRGLSCTPTADKHLATRVQGLPMADVINITKAWREGWRGEELDSNRGW
jgi:hypothetical protein